MTLLLGIAAPWGMWQSSDHRLTEWPGGSLITDSSMKHLSVKAPDGTALVTYTGLGRIDGQDISDWLRKTLRGEDRRLERTSHFIARRATAKIGEVALKLGVLHVFLFSAFLRGEPFIVAVANTDTPFGLDHPPLRPDFRVTPVRVTKPAPVLGGGGVAAISAEDHQLLVRVSGKKPKHQEDYQKLLAEVNRRAATSRHPSAALVSEGSLASYIPAGFDRPISSTQFGEALEPRRRFPPFLNRGIDMTEVGDLIAPLQPGEALNKQDWEQAIRRAIQREDS